MGTKINFNKSVIYLRVSTNKQQISGLGLEAQREICMNYIKQSGKEFVAEFKDVESGTHRMRPGLIAAIDFCKENNCELVFAKLDRLARDVEFTFRVINSGVQVHFCDMPQLNTLILGVMATVAQYERELISQRTKAALKAKKERGEKTGGACRKSFDMSKAIEASAIASKHKACNNINNLAFHEFISDWQAMHGRITAKTDWQVISDELNRRGKKTATGLPFDKNRAKSTYVKILKLYGNGSY